MAVTPAWQQYVEHIIAAHIARETRYRTLLFQSLTLPFLDGVVDAAQTVARSMSRKVHVADTGVFLDNIGAISYSSAIDHIDRLTADQLIVLAGPLQFIDYWSPPGRHTFWRHLATVNTGHGIVITDVPRDTETESAFRLITRIAGSDLYCFKSRLAAGEDGQA